MATSNVSNEERSTRIVFCDLASDPETVDRILAFRKVKFCDELAWPLQHENGRESDEFDTSNALYCALIERDAVVGCFRAIRTDYPYLAQTKFPELADKNGYPNSVNSYEITRLAVESGPGGVTRSVNCYAALLYFARELNLTSLVAFCDTTHERLLNRIGIETKRFGRPRTIGQDLRGRNITVVAGEIVLGKQDPKRLNVLIAPTRTMEIVDGPAIFRRFSLSA